LLIIGNKAVQEVLTGREQAVLGAVRQAYLRHAAGDTALPHSVFLRFPDDDRNRVIGLPAYLGGLEPIAGMKWIASFPGNVQQGLQRASAVIVLNSMRTGQPIALIEGSMISAWRTAASAALAATVLPAARPATGVSLLGCGVINGEVLRFLRAVHPDLREVTLFDLDRDRAEAFARRWTGTLDVTLVDTAEAALAAHPLISVATTATTPHLDLAACQPGSLVLHVSLRDVTVDAVLAADNIVDDADHVCRASTSLHLAEQRTGGREFIRAALGDLLRAGPTHPRDPHRVTLFSPFGLGVLDLAVADLVLRDARHRGLGVDLPDFLPSPTG
jgi:ornithine cyclodeaminase